MKHSKITRINENLVYQHAFTAKPVMEQSASQVEFNRALPEWENTAKTFLIKKADEPMFAQYIDAERITLGVDIPFELMEFYEDTSIPNRKFARLKGESATNSQTERAIGSEVTPTKFPSVPTEVPTQKKSALIFEIAIDDETGEPKLCFKKDNDAVSMEQKVLKSFLVKAMANGIGLIKVSENNFEINISNT